MGYWCKSWLENPTRTLVLVNLAGIMEQADEALLPGVYREVGLALHISPTQLGSLTLLRSVVQSACYPLAAYLAVHRNRAHVIALGAFLWAAATFLVGLSTTFAQKNHPKNVIPPSRRHFYRVDNEDGVIPMEEDDTNNTVEDDGANRLIQYLFSAPMDDAINLEEENLQDVEDDSDEDNADDYILDEPILHNTTEYLYEGTAKNVLSTVMLLVNLKVSNNLSNTCMK